MCRLLAQAVLVPVVLVVQAAKPSLLNSIHKGRRESPFFISHSKLRTCVQSEDKGFNQRVIA
jgi:hypothetical protein